VGLLPYKIVQVKYLQSRINDSMVKRALDIAYACRSGNHVRFFSLYNQCTKYGKLILHSTKVCGELFACIAEIFLIQWELRYKAITKILRAYSPARYPIQKFVKVLSFSSERAAVLYLNHIRVLRKDGQILCKESQKTIRAPRVKLRKEGQRGVTHNVL